MDLCELMTSRIDQMLEKVGPGLKVLLMDQETTTSVSLSYQQSKIMKKEVYLFEHLHSRVANKNSLSFMKCVVLIRPTKENLALLRREITSPRYSSYYLFFSNKVGRTDLKSLADSDTNEVVAACMEVPSDFLVFESHLFTVNLPRPVRNLSWNKSTGSLQHCVDSLRSFLAAIKAPSATVAFSKDSPICEELAQLVISDNDDPGSADAILIILDRRVDPVTPLLNQWTYQVSVKSNVVESNLICKFQAMIHELVGTSNNAVDLTGREGVPEEVKKVILSAETDEFYRLNMYANFGEIGQTMRNMIHKFQEKKKSHSKVESMTDIKDFLSSYPEFKKLSGTVTRHLALHEVLSNEINSNELYEVSKCEQAIACGNDKAVSIQELNRILSLPSVRTKDALRLLSLFTLRYSHEVERNLGQLCKSIHGLPQKEVYDVIQMMNKYSRIKSRMLFDNSSSNLLRNLKGIDNVFVQHQPLLTKEMLPDIIRGQMRPDLTYLSQPKKRGRVVIFIVGGVTYEESRAVHIFNRDNGSNVVLGGTSILNYDEFVNSVKEACVAQEK